jgi:hypothetical protein
MNNAITVRAVMAFSLLGFAPAICAADGTPVMTKVGAVEPCVTEEWGALPAMTDPRAKLMAAYGDVQIRTWWVRVFQQDQKFTVESTKPPQRRRNLDAALAQAIGTRMQADIAQDAFMLECEDRDEVYVDMPWSIFSADGKSCAMMDLMDQSTTAHYWSRLFEQLLSGDPAHATLAWFWLEQLQRAPATAPTPLSAVTTASDVVGAGSVWNHAGTRPLDVLSHGARIIDGDVVILGQVINRMPMAREDVQVVATFFDTDSNERAARSETVAFQRLPSGEHAPFKLDVPAGNFASYTLRIEAGSDAQLRPATVKIVNRHVHQDRDGLVITGTVRNAGKSNEDSVEVMVSLFDQAGHLLDCDSGPTDESLAPGASARFEVSFERPRGYHHYDVQVNPDYREKRNE